MGATLEALRALQDLQFKLTLIRHSEESKRRDVRAKQLKVDGWQEKLGAFEERRLAHQQKIDGVDLEIKGLEQKIEKLREDLNKSKTNREYATVLTALNTDKADVARLETLTLEYMGQIEELSGEQTDCRTEYDKAVQRAERATRVLDDYLSDTAEKRARLQEDYERAAEVVAPEALRRFTRAAEHHDGEGLAPVTKANPKSREFSCGTCNMTVTLEQLNGLRSRDDIQSCNGCGSILYLDAKDDD